MTRNALLIALGLSLVFNVFVLIGFARARSAMKVHTEDEARVQQRIARELDLDPQQETVLAKLRADHHEQSAFYDQGIALLRQNILAELRKENPDLAKVREYIDQESDFYRQRRLAGADSFGRFVGELRPPQRRQMLGRFMNMQHPHGRMQQLSPRVVERFDRNKDGRLDPDEMRDAMQEMQRRHQRQREGQLPPRSPQ